MKKILTISFLAMVISFMSSSFKPSVIIVKNSGTKIVLDDEWTPWQTSSCYKYLKYRMKRVSYSETAWTVQFKNDYAANITFTVKVLNGHGGDRITVKAGEKRKSNYYTNSSYIDINIEKAKFDDTSWKEPFAECDRF